MFSNTCWVSEWTVFRTPWSGTDVGLPACGDGFAGPHKGTEQCKTINLSLPCLSANIGGNEGLTWGLVEFMTLLPMSPAALLMRPSTPLPFLWLHSEQNLIWPLPHSSHLLTPQCDAPFPPVLPQLCLWKWAHLFTVEKLKLYSSSVQISYSKQMER